MCNVRKMLDFLNQQNEATLAAFSAKTHWNHQVIKCFRWNATTAQNMMHPLSLTNVIMRNQRAKKKKTIYNVLYMQSAIMFMCSVYNATIL